MASQGVVSTGSCLAISAAAPATLDEAGYGALTYTEWGEVTDFGSLGTTTNILEFTPVCTGFKEKRPSVKDSGNMAVKAMNVEADGAQVILQAAVDTTPIPAITCRLTLPTGAIRYFIAYPSSLTDDIGTADSLFEASVELAITGGILKVAA